MLQFGVFDLDLGEIMAFFQDEWIVGWVLIISGILAAVWLFQTLTDRIPGLGALFDGLAAIGTYLGFIVGILDMLVGYVVWATNPGGTIVAVVLVITGFALVMRLLSKFPLALLFALGIAAFATFTIYGFLSQFADVPIIGEIISLKWMAVIGVIIFIIVYLLGGLLIKLIQLIGKIFAWNPISMIIGLAALAVGIVVIWNPTLVGLVIPWPTP